MSEAGDTLEETVYLIPPGVPPLFSEDLEPDDWGMVAIGGDLTPETVIDAYRAGVFPWSGEDPIPWYSPDPRLILEPARFRASRSLRKRVRRGEYEIVFDRDFRAVIGGCSRMPRPGQAGTWITPNLIDVYCELHERGIAHSVEAYADGVLAGGLYGLTFGRAFFGESMFARRTDASKVALYRLCQRLVAWDFHFVDCQQVTRHLLSLGADPVPRSEYLARLRFALSHPSRHRPWATL